MATLIYSAAMSLDGFIAGPGGDMSWLAPHVGGADPAFGGRYEGPVVVLTHRPPAEPPAGVTSRSEAAHWCRVADR